MRITRGEREQRLEPSALQLGADRGQRLVQLARILAMS
ncbi:hypothetical protein JOE62_002890 [Glutamicibacter nicotianae]|nr:hypothetical protein [Glutamicibacter nicotianae]